MAAESPHDSGLDRQTVSSGKQGVLSIRWRLVLPMPATACGENGARTKGGSDTCRDPLLAMPDAIVLLVCLQREPIHEEESAFHGEAASEP